MEADGVCSPLQDLSPEEAATTLCIDSTTLDVQVGRAVASEIISLGAEMVDAPVSGGKLSRIPAELGLSRVYRRNRG